MRSLAPLTRGDVTGAKGTGGGDPRSVGDESSGTGGGIGQPWPPALPRGSCVCVCVCVCVSDLGKAAGGLARSPFGGGVVLEGPPLRRISGAGTSRENLCMWVWAVLWLCRDEHSLESIHRRVALGIVGGPGGGVSIPPRPVARVLVTLPCWRVWRARWWSVGVVARAGWPHSLLGVCGPHWPRERSRSFGVVGRGRPSAASFLGCLVWFGLGWSGCRLPCALLATAWTLGGAGSGVSDSRLVCSEVRCGRPRPPAAPRHVANAMGRFRGPARRKARPAPPGAASRAFSRTSS